MSSRSDGSFQYRSMRERRVSRSYVSRAPAGSLWIPRNSVSGAGTLRNVK